MDVIVSRWIENAPVLALLVLAWINERKERQEMQRMFMEHLLSCSNERCISLRTVKQIEQK